jgi:hypothetical protein
MTNAAADEATTVTAEDAPVGIQLWPTRSPEYAPNFTLASVAVVRNSNGEHVVWTYENGNQRVFGKGEQITVLI